MEIARLPTRIGNPMALELRPFQRRAVKALESGRYDTVVLSLPRAQGKSSLAAWIGFRALTPGDSLFESGAESHLVAASIGSARTTVFKILRRLVEDSDQAADYKVSESANACHVRHRQTNTRISVKAPSAKATLGLVGCPMVVVDEPGSYDLESGDSLWRALAFAQGKPDSPLRLFVIGHLAPRAVAPGHWFFDLVKRGTHGRTYVQAIQGVLDRWDQASEIRRCSPLSWSFPAARAKLLEQRNEARQDSAARAWFCSYRLNLPSEDEQAVLLTTTDWKAVVARPVGAPVGRPIVGIDLGLNRAWSSAVAIWPATGRIEAIACCSGIPDLRAQEKRDGVQPGTYQRLADAGLLVVAEGKHVPPVPMLLGLAAAWMPRVYVADAFNLPLLRDAAGRVPVASRRTRWSESTQDIGGLRRLVKDGGLSVAVESRPLLKASLAVTRVKVEESCVRIQKDAKNNRARDDVSSALTLAAGAVSRMPRSKPGARKVVVCAAPV